MLENEDGTQEGRGSQRSEDQDLGKREGVSVNQHPGPKAARWHLHEFQDVEDL